MGSERPGAAQACSSAVPSGREIQKHVSDLLKVEQLDILISRHVVSSSILAICASKPKRSEFTFLGELLFQSQSLLLLLFTHQDVRINFPIFDYVLSSLLWLFKVQAVVLGTLDHLSLKLF